MSVLDLIGNTPLVRIGRMAGPESAAVLAKLEGMNPGGSVKDRVARAVIEHAEQRGLLSPGATIVEATSGNTGIGLAMVAAVKGHRLILAMPETASAERKAMLEAYGAELVLTPKGSGMLGAIEAAEDIVRQHPSYYMPRQFLNPQNPEAHRLSTAREILRDLGAPPDAFVAGVGTGGTITGVGEVLREANPSVHIVAVEPARSAVLSGGVPGQHGITGIGAGFFSMVLNLNIYDEVIPVSDEDAEERTRELAQREGILAGISSGAALHAALQTARRLGPGKTVVVIFPDRGERYLSSGLFAPSYNHSLHEVN